MTSSSEKSMKLPEKSSFSQTCSLLSQYLKEGGSFGDLSLGITCNIQSKGASEMPVPMPRLSAPTMNLFPMIEISGDAAFAAPSSRNLESMNLFPPQAGFAFKKDTPTTVVDSSLNKPVYAPVDPQAAQMTIFYNGQVIVFNDFPAEKAKEVVLLASMGSSNNHTTTFPSVPAKTHNAFASNLAAKSPTVPPPTGPVAPSFAKNPIEPNSSMPSSSKNIIPNFGINPVPEVQPPQRSVTCDLPIARRNSLHRFLEKRKDRIVARAPYLPSSPSSSSAAPNKPAESKSWLGLAAQSAQ
ncbi:hypothetical protein Ddye_020259 [Dipteronia dyeriana]|uniref:Protein TIFY n=1 Tax=Dipteronia dyeriana TaxID=168575 RepID=A0AAD9U0D6_9ROSI|nr:hypothetical protein Ddye_020259 [Dipteronia dyeriana]